MADFDVSVIVRLVDQLSAGAQGVKDSLKSIQTQAETLQNAGLKGSLNFVNALQEQGPAILAAASKMDAGWQKMKVGAQGVSDKISSIFGVVRRLGVVTGLSLGGGVLAVNRWAAATKEQQAFANQIGISIDALRGYSYAADIADVSQGTLNTSLSMLGRNLGDLQGDLQRTGKTSNPLYEIFKSDPTTLRAIMTGNTEQAFFAIMEAAKDMSPETRAAVMQAAFGRGGREMARFADVDIGALMHEQQRYAGPTSPAAIKAAQEYADAITRLSEAWRGMKDALMTPIAGLLTEQLKALTEWMAVPANREWVSAKTIEGVNAIRGFINDLKETDWSTKFSGLKTYLIDPLLSVKDALGGWVNFTAAMTALYLAKPVITTLVGLFQVMKGMEAIFIAFGTAFKTAFAGAGGAGLAATGVALAAIAAALLSIYEHWDDIKPAWEDLKASVTEFGNAIKPIVDSVLTPFADALKALGVEIPTLNWGNLTEGWDEQSKTFAREVVEFLNSITAAIRGFNEAVEAAKRGGLGAWLNKNLGMNLFAEAPKPIPPSAMLGEVPPTFGPGAAKPGWPEETEAQKRALMEKFAAYEKDWSELAELYGKRRERGLYPGAPAIPSWTAPSTVVPSTTIPFIPSAEAGIGGWGGGIQTTPAEELISRLHGAMTNLIGSNLAASVAAAAPPTGMAPPPGITFQARGPDVVINQAPPNTNIGVTVYVTSPDAAPITTANAIGNAIAGKAQGRGMFDGVNE